MDPTLFNPVKAVLYVVSIMCGALVIGYGLWLLLRIPTNRWRAAAFDHVYVNDDGSVRELQSEEEDQLNSLYFTGDDLPFFIKRRYESPNPSGGLSGYLKRRQLPRIITSGRPLNR